LDLVPVNNLAAHPAYIARLQSPDVAPTEQMVTDLRQKLDKRYQIQVKDGRIHIITPDAS